MNEFNFLTEEYKLKLYLENLIKIVVMFLFIFIGIEIGISSVFSLKVNKQNVEISKINNEIKSYDQKSKKVKEARGKIPDLTNEISIVEELISQKSLKYSEILYIIQENTPNKVWYTLLIYNKNQVLLHGYSAKDINKKISKDINVFLLEKNLKQTKKFRDVKIEYMKNKRIMGNEVKEFKYTLTVK